MFGTAPRADRFELALEPERHPAFILKVQPRSQRETLAAYNLEVFRSFLAKAAVTAEMAKQPRARKKRLKQTWRDVVVPCPQSGPDPPPAG